MAKGDTKTNQYLDIAANGTRSDFPASCCETRSQTLIREVGERIMDLEDEVERLENNPDVADIVATYADLQSYDTSQLTDKDVIRVLQDETHDGDSTYYRWSTSTSTWTYIGESKQYTDFVGTDGTEAGEAGLVPAPATTDADKFLSASGLWEEVQSGGGATELTAANYDWPTNNPIGVKLWDLETGWYVVGGNSNIYVYSSSTMQLGVPVGTTIYIRKADTSSSTNETSISVIGQTGSIKSYSTRWSDGYASNTMGSTTVGVVQTTGNNSGYVMSQNATSSMVFADPADKKRVQIAAGANASSASTDGVAIGHYATVNEPHGVAIGQSAGAYAPGSIALGYGSSTSTKGVMSIESTYLTACYNNTQYRLLTGLYDPQSAHDAATKGYVDTVADSKQDELTAGTGITIEEESGALVISSTGGGATTLTNAEFNAIFGTSLTGGQ